MTDPTTPTSETNATSETSATNVTSKTSATTTTNATTTTKILPTLLLLAVLLVVGYLVTNPAEGQRVLVELGLAQPVQQGYVLSGLLEAETVRLGSPQGGVVRVLHVREGQTVRAGDLLAELDADLLRWQEQAAEAALAQAQAQWQMAQRGARESDLAVAQAAVAQAQVGLEVARQALQDAETAADQPGGEARRAQAQAQVAQAEAALRAAQAQQDALAAGAGDADLQAAQAAVDAAQAELERIRAQIAAQSLHAPQDAVVAAILLREGELALPGQAVLLLRPLDRPLHVTVYLPESDLDKAAPGRVVTIRADAFPDRTFTGRVVHIADRAEFTPRNVQTPEDRVILVYAVRIAVDDPEGVLKPGLPVDVIFEVQP